MQVIAIDGHEVFVDEEDYPIVSRIAWKVYPNGNTHYAVKGVDHGRVSIHRLILGLPHGAYDVDHINGNGLDNRKCNLRLTSKSGNRANTPIKKHYKGQPIQSNYKGVSILKSLSKGYRYTARVQKNGIWHCCGTFDTEEEAAMAYDTKASELFGEYARLNLS